MDKLLKSRWLLAIMMLLLTTTFTACGDDDEPSAPTTTNGSLVGKWETTSTYRVNGVPDSKAQLVFNSDGRGQVIAVYSNGYDNDVYGFEYTTSIDSDNDLSVKFLFTGTSSLLFESGQIYYPTVTKTRMYINGMEFKRI